MNDVIVPGKVQPEMFWKAYKSKLLQIASSAAKQAYRSDFEWTPYAMNAAMRAVESLGLVPQGEYFRLDAIGYERHGTHDWTLRVAFEHENRDHWTDELCKLCHIVADLRVLVSYWNFKKDRNVETCVEGHLKKLESRIVKNPGKWLFIFGPRCKSFGADCPYVAYASDGKTLIKLEDDGGLNPFNWPDNGPGCH